MRLKDKVAIVTGASSGLGRAIAKMYIKEGAKVVFSDINEYEGIESLGEQAFFMKADVSKSEEVKALIDETINRFGKLDIIVNNAGIGTTGNIHELSDENWQKVIDINLNGVFYGLRGAAAYMKEKGVKGSIINMASILGEVGFRGAGAYSASKGGVNQLTKTSALELAPDGIRVNSIAPGFILTEMTKGIDADPKAGEFVRGSIPLGHMGEPDDIAYAAVYLASDESKFVTGSILYVDGGWIAQ
ncbi:MAG: SDR family NAD(P)-dependent oxidoreductase [Patescibacteria group bacterium]|jgi:NAD(P)-dependent dehydrogenase (short-subunit alcohol dehydrogenase family)|nr:SDR family NAD(P)-dependent oxidoreductase [Patescibacteria group bacterium]